MGRRPAADPEGRGIRAASNTSIVIDFYYRGVRCRERLKLRPSAANMKYAVNLKGEIENAIEKGTFDYDEYFPDSRQAQRFSKFPGALISVKDALTSWHKKQRNEIERSTWLDYRNSIDNHLIPRFGHHALTKLTRPVIKDWIASLDVSKKRIDNLLIPLRQTLSEATEDGLIKGNPLANYKVKRKGAPAQEQIDPFSIDEIRAIIDALPPQAGNMIQFAFWAGLRTSELIALEWGDIDWARNEFSVRRARVRKEIKGPKTESGIRIVKLLEPALDALTRQQQYSYLAGKEIFHNDRTQVPWVGDAAIRKTAWLPALRKAKVRYRYPYQTRHTYASMMLSAGENPLWVAAQMGHKDWSMIVRTYGKWIPEADPLAGAKAVTLWSVNKSIGQHTVNTND